MAIQKKGPKKDQIEKLDAKKKKINTHIKRKDHQNSKLLCQIWIVSEEKKPKGACIF